MKGNTWLGPPTILFLILGLCFVLSGCGEEGGDGSSVTGLEVGGMPDNIPLVIGAYTSIAWPFGPNEHPDDWRGDEGDRTNGGMISACGGWISSHSGADYYARDLSRRSGTTSGKKVYAGISGRVVKANWTDCYGNSVVIYDHSRRLAIRYAHLQSITVSQGDWVTIRQYIGKVGNTGCGSFNAHLHLVAYENIDHFINGDHNRPVIPTVCDSDYYSCRIYFFC